MFRNLELRDRHYLFFITILALFFFRGMFLHPELSYASRDALDIYAFEYTHRYNTFWNFNQLSLWNPHVYGGIPFFVGVGVFYPFNLLFLLSNSFFLMNFYQLFHVLLAGLLMYTFVRLIRFNPFCSFISAITFMFGGNLLTKVGGAYPQLASYALLPLMFLLLELLLRKKQFFYCVLFGVGLSLLFFAGHQQYFYMISLALGFYFFLKLFNEIKRSKLISLFMLAYLIAFLLSAIAFFPIAEFSSNLSRLDKGIKGTNYEYVSSGSLPFKQLTNFIMPNLYGNGWQTLNNGLTTYWGAPTYNELYVYMGLIPLFLVLFALRSPKRVWHFIILALFALIYALGANTPLFDLILKIPGANLFRTPGRMLMVVSFCFAVIAAHGFNVLEQKKFSKWFVLFGILSGIFAFAATFIIYFFRTSILEFGKQILYTLYYEVYANSIFVQTHSFDSLIQLGNLVYNEAFYAILSFSFFLVLIIIGLLLLKNSSLLLKTFVVIILIADVFFFNSQLVQGSDISSALDESGLIIFLKEQKADNSLFRILGANPELFRPYSALKYDIHLLLGAGSSRIKSFDDFLHKGLNIVDKVHARIKWGELIIPKERLEFPYTAKLLGMWNVKYVLSREEIANNDFKQIFKNSDGIIYENQKVLPRAFVVGAAKILPADEILAGMQKDSFDPKEIVLFSTELPNQTNKPSFREAKITKYSPNEIIVKVSLDAPGYLVLADNYYPGWVAYDNCVRKPVLRANYAQRAVHLEQGKHIIKFRRKPNSLIIGRNITLATIGFTLLYLISVGLLKWKKLRKN